MLKVLQARLQQYVNRELSDVQPGFIKGRGTEIKFLTSVGSLQKQENTRKASISTLLIIQKCVNDPDNHDGVVTHLESDILE